MEAYLELCVMGIKVLAERSVLLMKNSGNRRVNALHPQTRDVRTLLRSGLRLKERFCNRYYRGLAAL